MNVLFVVPYVPNLVRVRPYNIIRALLEQGDAVTVATLWTQAGEQADIIQLQRLGATVHALPMPAWRSLMNCLTVLPSKRPFQSAYSWTPELLTRLDLTQFDVAHVEHLRGANFALALKQSGQLPVVWDSVDCISHLFRQAAAESKSAVGKLRSRLDLKRTEWFEGWMLEQVDRVLVTSPADRDALLALTERQLWEDKIIVIPNGSDLSYFAPNSAETREEETLVVSGKMSYHANVSMTLNLVNNIMPHVWAKRPSVKLWIVGKDPTRDILTLAEHEGVTVTGTVPDLRPYLQQATIAVAPLVYGAGIQNKVLEAMACATPVITSAQATKALLLEPGKDLLVADEPKRFAQHILDLLADPQRQQEIGENGRSYVTREHNWQETAVKLRTIYQTAIDQHRRKARAMAV